MVSIFGDLKLGIIHSKVTLQIITAIYVTQIKINHSWVLYDINIPINDSTFPIKYVIYPRVECIFL